MRTYYSALALVAEKLSGKPLWRVSHNTSILVSSLVRQRTQRQQIWFTTFVEIYHLVNWLTLFTCILV